MGTLWAMQIQRHWSTRWLRAYKKWMSRHLSPLNKVEAEALVDTLAYTVAEVEAEKRGETLVDV